MIVSTIRRLHCKCQKQILQIHNAENHGPWTVLRAFFSHMFANVC